MAGVDTIESGLELSPAPASSAVIAAILLPRTGGQCDRPVACHDRIVIFLSGTGHRIDLGRVIIGSTFIFIAQSTSQQRIDGLNTTKPAVRAVEQQKIKRI